MKFKHLVTYRIHLLKSVLGHAFDPNTYKAESGVSLHSVFQVARAKKKEKRKGKEGEKKGNNILLYGAEF